MRAYYNEWEPYAAAWLRNLIAAGLLPAGDVDERDVMEVTADDLRGYTQCHFFAGIGGWPYALQLAGWPDDRPIWTASLPCQPFSAAGRGQGEADERHLWPAFRRLVAVGRPPALAGEQVSSKLGRGWLAGVRADLEGMGYRVGAADLCAAGVGAPHIRQRLFWVADTERGATERRTSGVGHAEFQGLEGYARYEPDRHEPRRDGTDPARPVTSASGPWDHAVLIPCGDGKARRIEPGLEPLVAGLPFKLADGRTVETASRRLLLQGLGNAIVPQVAAAFMRAYMEAVVELAADVEGEWG